MILLRSLLKKNHAERLALWKQKQSEENKAKFKSDVDRIVTMIDRNMYGLNKSPNKRNFITQAGIGAIR